MKRLIFLIGIMLMSLSGIAQYPIKTIFKGDSVIILTIQQSEKINEMLDKSSKSIKETSKKNKEYEEEIQKLNNITSNQNAYIDSLSNLLLERWTCNEDIYDSIWTWALGPSIIYTLYPDDSTVYVMDLSHYYMTTDDFGIIMARMSDKEYLKYQAFISKYGLSEEAFWRFRNEIKVKRVKDNEMKEKKVWKSKMTIKKHEEEEK
jgi:hypothetical protein